MSCGNATCASFSAHPHGSSANPWLWTVLCLWRARARQRARLAALPPHLLADIGVDRLEADREASKPFWRA
ncbi:MAG: DUF1127 domain-containing protein [Rhodobacteraceae bacterium]|nr:DUF1127 domain-containing protein [Paracoccaceae bacterium]